MNRRQKIFILCVVLITIITIAVSMIAGFGFNKLVMFLIGIYIGFLFGGGTMCLIQMGDDDDDN